MPKILVVGGAGYIGGAVTELLIATNVPFTVYDSLIYEPHYLKKVDFVRGDIRDTAKLGCLLPSYSHVIWLAAIVGDGACEVNPSLTIEVNEKSAEWLSRHFSGRILFTSTCSVYGQHDSEADEESFVNPLSLYARTKLKAESFLHEQNCLIFRLGTAFGVSDTYSRPRMDLAVNYMTANALIKGELTIYGGGQWRPLIHVKDIAQAIVDNLERPVRGVYNLATANLQIKELAAVISQMTGCRIRHTEQKFQDQRDYHVDCRKALRDNLFNPHTTLTVQDGVREIAELVRTERIKETESEIYSNVRHVENLKSCGQLA
jgi:nucleoside-diphosphate-sugar epimerase